MLPVPLKCSFSIASSSIVYLSRVLCSQCYQCLQIVHSLLPFHLSFICLVSCVPNVASTPKLSILYCFFLYRLFVSCLVCPMLPIPRDCPFSMVSSSIVYLSRVLCAQCCQYPQIVHSLLLFPLSFICLVSCVPNVASAPRLSILYCFFLHRLFVSCLVFPMLPVPLKCSFSIASSSIVYLSRVLCSQCYQCLQIVHSLLPFHLSFICLVSCVPNVASTPKLSILYCFFLYRLFVSCLVCPMQPIPRDCPFSMVSSSIVYLSRVLCAQCCQCPQIVHSLLLFPLSFICLVSCVPNVASASRLSILHCFFLYRLFVSCLVFPMLSVPLDCAFSITSISIVYLSRVLCAQCCQCLQIVHSLLPFPLSFICLVSCVSNVASTSRLSILYGFFLYCLFVSCLVCPMLPVPLDCLFSIAFSSIVYLSRVLCAQCCQYPKIVHSLLLFPLSFICLVFYVPNVVSTPILSILYGFFRYRLFVSCLVCPMLPVPLDWPFSIAFSSIVYLSRVLCSSCYQCLQIVHSLLPFPLSFICLVSCVPNVASTPRLSILYGFFLYRLFVSCLVCPMLPVPLDCPFSIASSSIVYLSRVLCSQCYQCLQIVHSLFPFPLSFICLVSCVPNVASASRLSILYCFFLYRLFVSCLVFPMLPVPLKCSFSIASSSIVYLSRVLCSQCYQCLQIVHSLLPFHLSFICLVSCVPNVASTPKLSILYCFFLYRLFVSCLVCPMLPIPRDCPFSMVSSSIVYLSRVLCAQCCQYPQIVHSLLLFPLSFICLVSCVPNVASAPRLSILYCFFLHRLFVSCLVFPMLPVPLKCSFSIASSSIVYLSRVLCSQCYQCLQIVHSLLPFHLSFICLVSCVPNVASTPKLSILYCSFLYRLFVSCLVCPMQPIPRDCPFSMVSSSIVYLSRVLCAQCCQCPQIVHSLLLFPLSFICLVSCVPNVASASRLSILHCFFLYRLFVSCLVFPMLSVPLDCAFSITSISIVYLSRVLCAQCCQCLQIVHSLLPFPLSFICLVSCVSNVASTSRLSILYGFFLYCLFVSCLVCPMLPVPLDCLFSIAFSSIVYLSRVLCAQCCQYPKIVHSLLLFPLSFICLVFYVPNVVSTPILSILYGFFRYRLFVSCLVCPMLPVPLDWPFSIAFSSIVYLSPVLCSSCYQCLQIVHSLLPFPLSFICLVSCVPNVASTPRLSILYGFFLYRLFVSCLVCPMLPVPLDCPFSIASSSIVYLSRVLCSQCYQCLQIVHSLFPFPLSFICLVSCVPNVASASRLSILYCFFLYRLFVSCLVCPMLPVPLDCPFSIAFSSIVYLSRVLCDQCCQYPQMVHSLWLLPLSFICLVSCVPNVASAPRLSILYCFFLYRLFVSCLVFPMLPVPLDCPFSIAFSSIVYVCRVLCSQCCQCLQIVHSLLLLPLSFICLVSCVPNVASTPRLSILYCVFLYRLCVSCLVFPMLPVPLDCPFSIASSSIVYLSRVLCSHFTNASRSSILYCFFLYRLFVSCLLFPMLPVPLDCPFSIASSSIVYLSRVLCSQCCQCLQIVHSLLLLPLSFICLVSCVLNVASIPSLSILYCLFLYRVFVSCLVCPMLPVPLYCPFSIASSSIVYLSRVLCAQSCQYPQIVHSLLLFPLSFICLVSCVPNVASTPRLSILYCFFLYRLFVSCFMCPMLSVPLDCPFSMASSSIVYLSRVLCSQCCQCLQIVHFLLLLPLSFICLVSCVPNVTNASRLSILYCLFLYRLFVSCLVCPMLPVPLDCPFSIAFSSIVYFSRVLCAQCCQYPQIVHSLWLLPLSFICLVSCVPNVASAPRLSNLYCFFLYHLFVSCLVFPMLPMPLDCPFSIAFPSIVYLSRVLCAQCCQCLQIVHSLLLLPLSFICLVSCVPYVASTPRLSILYCFFLYRLFVSCLVCPMLPVPLDCPFSIASSSIVYLSRVLCSQCCQCLQIVHSLLLLPLSFICLVSCVPNVASAPRLSILYCSFLYRLFVSCLVFPMLPVPLECPFSIASSSIVYLSRVLCSQCYQCLQIVHSLLPFHLSFICFVSCVPNVASASRLSIFYNFFLYRLFVSCLVCPMLAVPRNCPFSMVSSSIVYLSRVLCAQCCQCLKIVHSLLLLPLSFICLVSCVLNVASAPRLSILYCLFLYRLFVSCLVCPMLPVPLDCPFSMASSSIVYLCRVLCAQCCKCPQIVHSLLRFPLSFICLVACVPNVASASRLSILYCVFLYRLFVLCLVFPMLPMPLDCPFSIAFSSIIYLSRVLCSQC